MKKIPKIAKNAVLFLIAIMMIFGLGSPSYNIGITASAAEAFTYVHDPELNPNAMKDIVRDNSAVYGFRPNETGSLKQYADLDWADEELVEQARQDRIAYHESIETMYEMLYQMTYENKITEDIARAVSIKRNEIRLEAYKDDPEGLEVLKERNLEKYGHEEGPLPEELYEKYGSWEMVIEKAFSPNVGMDACLGLYDDYFNTYVMLGIIEDDSLLPHKVDLRDFNDKNYVTPVRFQNPFGTCWSFALAATAEECFLFDNDMGVPAGKKNEQVNFSEKYITWYTYHHITELDGEGGNPYIASQVGEGYYVDDNEKYNQNAVFDLGGFSERAVNLFMAGLGLINECIEINGSEPFVYSGAEGLRNNNRDEDKELAEKRREFYYNRNKLLIGQLISEGKISSPEEFDEWFNDNWVPGKNLYENTFRYGCYSPVDDWTVPDGADYLLPAAEAMVKSTKKLISPAGIDENGEYLFNSAGLDSIKYELTNGHAVCIGIFADRSTPDDEDLTENCIINFDHWAQYYSDVFNSNHAVTIIGYDDNYPKEYFTRTFDGNVVEGSTPPANGAFIVKNSWGSADCEEDDPNYSDWGYEKSGYFYLSYYDHSLVDPFTLEFYSNDEIPCTEVYYDQYDLLFNTEYEAMLYVEPVIAANVFSADEDSFIGWISAVCDCDNTTVYYAVYKDPEDGKPDSGTLLESGEQTFEYPGYKSIELNNKYFLKKGEKYSVVILNAAPFYSEETGDMTVFPYVYPILYNFQSQDGRKVSTVINQGESYRGYNDNWSDYTDFAEYVRDIKYDNICSTFTPEDLELYYKNGINDVVIDNLPIKALLIPASEYTCPHTELDKILRVEPTEKSDGHTEYYICHFCFKWFEDEACTKEITDHSSIVLPALDEDKPHEDDEDKPHDDTEDKPHDDTEEKPHEDKPYEDIDVPVVTPTDDTDKPSTRPGRGTDTIDPDQKNFNTGNNTTDSFMIFTAAFSGLSIIVISLTDRKRKNSN